MWLDTVDHVFIALKNHHQFSAVLFPDKNSPAVTAAENVIFAPEVGFLDLQKGTTYMKRLR